MQSIGAGTDQFPAAANAVQKAPGVGDRKAADAGLERREAIGDR
jgi:hypothetical protein